MKQFGRSVLWLAVFISAGYFIVMNVPPILGIGNEKLDDRRALERTWLIIHLSFGSLALLLGSLQFWPVIRSRYPAFHRTIGKLYIIFSITASLMAFYLLSNYPLPASIPSLLLLNTLWLFSTIIAYLFAMKKLFKFHRQFMIRSYVFALAFVFIRLLDKIDHYSGMFDFIKDKETRATFIDWAGWIVPAVITEFFLQWWPILKTLNKARAMERS